MTNGDHRAAELAETFADLAEMALNPGDETIKTLGDAELVTSESPTTALAFLRRLHNDTRRIEGFPLFERRYQRRLGGTAARRILRLHR